MPKDRSEGRCPRSPSTNSKFAARNSPTRPRKAVGMTPLRRSSVPLLISAFTSLHLLRQPQRCLEPECPRQPKGPSATKKAVPGSLILARLRIGEIYSLWLYRISSFVSFIIPHEVESFNSKSFLAFFGECKT